MYKIIDKKQLTPLIYSLDVEAPRIASSAKPGQFLIVRPSDNGERVPLTICDYDSQKGTVRIVVQIAGVSSNKICRMNAGDFLCDVAGPLGKPSDFMELPYEELKGKRYLFVAGGVGAAPVYPQAKYLFEAGAHVDVIIGARNRDLIIMEDEMKAVCTNLHICTDDGSKGEKGVVTILMERLAEEVNDSRLNVRCNRSDGHDEVCNPYGQEARMAYNREPEYVDGRRYRNVRSLQGECRGQDDVRLRRRSRVQRLRRGL